jgi:hypothetical protein
MKKMATMQKLRRERVGRWCCEQLLEVVTKAQAEDGRGTEESDWQKKREFTD